MDRRSFSDQKKDKFVKCLEKNLYDLNLDVDPNQAMDNLMRSTKDAINEVFPMKKVTRKHAELIQKSWLTQEIIKEGKIRDELQRKSIKSKLPEDWSNFRKIQNKV